MRGGAARVDDGSLTRTQAGFQARQVVDPRGSWRTFYRGANSANTLTSVPTTSQTRPGSVARLTELSGSTEP